LADPTAQSSDQSETVMTPIESGNLEAGQRVCWVGSAKHLGWVVSIDWSGVEIGWDSGHSAYRHHGNMSDITRAAHAEPPQSPVAQAMPGNQQISWNAGSIPPEDRPNRSGQDKS
jgi:hypothetical protein